ncbi:MAG: ABC transporter ATP-binding protein [Rhodocyclaceae bacterium]|nr:ABC transporter ATP-binding protein [Rhodocyclaceae bacterium]MCO5097914.1 ABC transporter ATP-binding protein [Rhodocyclaceae bacterium]
MSSDIVISARGLTKTYRLFGHPGDRVKQFVSFGLKQYHREFTALKDVSFDIRKGETIGIIGRNGSGKSTLLQLVCGILKPTSGSVTVNGRVSALLELGAGFNPEFTGRENVFFQGAIMGFSRQQMDERFDDIVAFADIGEFIDQPVRTYSSGMFVRLAFAVAIHVDADILVVDEALAVGDIPFQAKCVAFFRQFRARGGTMLIVSHDMNIINALCDFGISLSANDGCQTGPAIAITETFLQSVRTGMQREAISRSNNRQSQADADGTPEFTVLRKGTGEARVTAVEMLDELGQPLVAARFNQHVKVRLHIQFNSSCEILAAYYIRDDNNLLLGSSTLLEGVGLMRGDKEDRLTIEFSTRLPLTDGPYSILVQLSTPIIQNSSAQIVDYLENAAVFTMEQHRPNKLWSKAYIENTVTITKDGRE